MQTYFTASQSPSQGLLYILERLAETPPNWTFTPGEHGGVAIKQNSSPQAIDLNSIQNRVESFLEILDKTSDDTKSEVFIGIVRKWLSLLGESDPVL